jgi:AcrR family transcriptional regulator
MSVSSASAAPPDRKESTRVEILEAAAAVIAERGFHGMSMRELSRSLGRSLAGLYTYFSSKEELMQQLQTRALLTLNASAEEAIRDIDEPSARLYAFILSHVRYVASHHAVMQVLVQRASAIDDERRRNVRETKERYFALAKGLVEAVVRSGPEAEGSRPDVDDAELERLTYSLFGMLNWTYGWYRPEQHGSPRKLARSIFSMAVCGLSSTRAREEALHEVEDSFADRQLAPLLSLGNRSTKES